MLDDIFGQEELPVSIPFRSGQRCNRQIGGLSCLEKTKASQSPLDRVRGVTQMSFEDGALKYKSQSPLDRVRGVTILPFNSILGRPQKVSIPFRSGQRCNPCN